MGGLAISCIEKLPMLPCLFETASAIGTVGLSLGITPQLGIISRIILILLMFFGRVGGLTLVFAAFSITHKNVSKTSSGKNYSRIKEQKMKSIFINRSGKIRKTCCNEIK